MPDKSQRDLQLLIRAANVLRRETLRLRAKAEETVKEAAAIRAQAAYTLAVLQVQRLLRRLKPE